MQVVAFNGSPRKQGNTVIMIDRVLQRLAGHGIDGEIVHLASVAHGCKACEACRKLKQDRCFQKDDPLVNEHYQKMLAADCIILGSPVYSGSCSAPMNALIEKVVYFSRGGSIRAGKPHTTFRHKLGVSLVSTRRSGAIQALHDMDALFAHTQMYMPNGGRWPVCVGNNAMHPGAALFDTAALASLDVLADNIAHILKKIAEARRNGLPEDEA